MLSLTFYKKYRIMELDLVRWTLNMLSTLYPVTKSKCVAGASSTFRSHGLLIRLALKNADFQGNTFRMNDFHKVLIVAFEGFEL